MLVLGQKQDDIVVIRAPGYAPITITTVEIRGDKIRLGLAAPRSVEINRIEVDREKHPEDHPATVGAK